MEEGMFGKHRPFLLASSDGCSVFQFRTDEGDGTMTCYEVFPGAMLSFNDFHMPYFQSEYVPGKKIFAIDHCREGRMEYLAAENAYAYIKAGDMKLDGRKKHTGRFVFPSSHYHGVTVAFDVEAAYRALKTASIDPENEHLIQGALSELTRGKTIITIAHRLATIEQADQILVLDEGRIVQQGTHRELAGQPGKYRQFVSIRQKAEGWTIQ